MKKKSIKALSIALSMIFTMSAAGSVGLAAEAEEGKGVISDVPVEVEVGDGPMMVENETLIDTQEGMSLPESFDLRNVDGKNYVTPVKSQGRWGTCWSFGSIAACESSILYELSEKTGLSPDNFDVDLSELHNAWFAYSQVKGGSQDGEGVYFTADDEESAKNALLNGGLDFGGFSMYTVSNLASGIGPVDDALAVYKNKSDYHLFYKLDKETGKRLRDENNEPVFEIHPADWKWSEDELFKDSGAYGTVGEDWSVSDEIKYNAPYLESAVYLPSPAVYSLDEEGNYVYTYNEDASTIMKAMLLSGKAIDIAFCADSSRFDELESESEAPFISENYAHYTYDELSTPYYDPATLKTEIVSPNHEVCIVGYDDNYSKDNFKKGTSESTGNDMTPPADGAWIVKNSWGSVDGEFPNKAEWGVDGSGYFYISYYDKSFITPVVYDFDVENMYPEYFGGEKQEKIVQQYDMLNVGMFYSAPSETEMKYANVFTAEQDQYLTEISTLIAPESPSQATYQVYRLNENAKNPTDGELISEFEGEYYFTGYYTEKLPEKQLIKKGEKYSIVITNTDGVYYYASFAASEGKAYAEVLSDVYGENLPFYSKGVINEGESFVFEEGEWNDFSTELDDFNTVTPGTEEEAAYFLEKYGTDESAVIPDWYAVDNFKIKAIAEPAVLSDEETTTTTTTTTSSSSTETETTTVTTTTAAETTTQSAKYSNDELAEMAAKLFEEENGSAPENVTVTENADGTVSIDLDGKETYTVDAETGKGTDADGNAVNLPATGMTSPFAAAAGAGAVVMTLLGGIVIAKSKKKDE